MVDLHGANLEGANLSWANLSRANLEGAELIGADLTEAHLTDAHLRGANFTKATLRGAILIRAGLVEANLTEADLTDAHLRRADIRSGNLRGANLTRAELVRANLTRAELVGADLSGAHLFRAELVGADLTDASLEGAFLLETDFTMAVLVRANLTEAVCADTGFTGATLTGCKVYGISAWDVYLHAAKQADLRITPLDVETNITVDNLEVAQFLYLLLNKPKVRDLVDTITSKVVLILGRFSDERKPVLDALRDALRNHPNGYIPVLFDFDPQTEKPIFGTMKTLANLARFVIADLTDPDMVRSELSYITANLPTVAVQPVILTGAHLPTEYDMWRRYPSFLPVFEYADRNQLLASFSVAVITPVEGHVRARRLADADSAP
jgi:uncharacterized protein YjbI with pentapeptide repeats